MKRGKQKTRPATRTVGQHRADLQAALQARTPGQAPGSPVYHGKRDPTKASLSLILFNQASWRIDYPLGVKALMDAVDPASINWINVNGLLGGAVEGICERLGVHPLVVEDILDCNQRPKVENYDDYLFIVTKMLSLHEDGFIEYEQVCLIVTDSVVVTFQETPGDCFGPLRERIATGGGRLRHSGSDYLAYAILDVIVDNYYRVLEHIGDNLDRFEMQAADPSEARSYMTELQGQREELLKLRRILWPVRDSIASLSRVEGGRLSADLFPFLRDLQENIIQVVEAVETYREHASSILEIHLASVSNRMNEVMKVLTVISTIFIPLTFLAGVYGMNFQHMPELALRWAYPALLLFMAALAGAMLVFFKRKHWF